MTERGLLLFLRLEKAKSILLRELTKKSYMEEETMELSEEMKKEIEKAKSEIKKGKFYTHEEVKRELGL